MECTGKKNPHYVFVVYFPFIPVNREVVKAQWTILRNKYMWQKREAKTKSGQAAQHTLRWEFMDPLSFLNSNIESMYTFECSRKQK